MFFKSWAEYHYVLESEIRTTQGHIHSKMITGFEVRKKKSMFNKLIDAFYTFRVVVQVSFF